MGSKSKRHTGFKIWLIGFVAAWFIRLVSWTLRFRVEDPGGILTKPPEGSIIWLTWHNRIFVVPYVYRKYLPKRYGAVLTSASKDGEIIARVMKRFGADAIRGSSSRRSKAALKAMMDRLGKGEDLCITPDGPRGPKYVMQPGAVGLAQATGAKLFPIHVKYHKAWRLKSWDRFFIPKPFSKVSVTLGELFGIEKTESDEEFAEQLAKAESILREGVDPSELEQNA